MKAKVERRKAKVTSPRTWRGWAAVHHDCANVHLTLYKSKADLHRNGTEGADEVVRVEAREVKP
jgi:hypothetical protein